MAYAEIRPVHVAELLSREGHPMARRVFAARARIEEADEAGGRDPRASARRTLGVAAGAMIVMGSVVGAVLGFDNGTAPAPSAAGEPVGVAPSILPNQGPPAPGQPQPAQPAVDDDDSTAPRFTNVSATDPAPRPAGKAGEIGAPASVKSPNVGAPRTSPEQPAQPEQPAPPAQPAQPAPERQAPAGPVESVTAPVTETVERTGTLGRTINDVVAPVTETVDDTLQPAMSLIGGLLSR